MFMVNPNLLELREEAFIKHFLCELEIGLEPKVLSKARSVRCLVYVNMSTTTYFIARPLHCL